VTSLGLTFLSASPSKSGGVTQSIKTDSGTPASQPAAPAPSAPAPSGGPASKSSEIPK
jgi:hypothetical protein